MEGGREGGREGEREGGKEEGRDGIMKWSKGKGESGMIMYTAK